MNNENEIERIAKKICKSSLVGCNFPTCSKCGIKDTCKARIYATRAVNAGYGDKKQAVKEFAEKLKSGTHRFGVVDGNNYYVWYDSDIDNLITELYGADECL